MSTTTRLGLSKIDRGQIRFDLAVNEALDELDKHYSGTDPSILGIGHESKTLSFRPLGVERASLGADALRVNGGIKLGTFTGTPETGMMRNNAGTAEVWNGSSWVTMGAGGTALTGAGISGRLPVWNGTGTLTYIPNPTAKSNVSIGSGSRLLYTCPVSTRAIYGCLTWFSAAVAVTAYYVPNGQVVGSTFKLWNNLAYTSVPVNQIYGFVLDPGDKIYVDSGGTSITSMLNVLEFPIGSHWDTYKRIYQVSLSTAGNGTTVLTMAAGKSAGGLISPQLMTNAFGQYIWFHNANAGAATLSMYHHDGTTDRQIWTGACAAGATAADYIPLFGLVLESGHSLKIKSSVANVNVYGVMNEWTQA